MASIAVTFQLFFFFSFFIVVSSEFSFLFELCDSSGLTMASNAGFSGLQERVLD